TILVRRGVWRCTSAKVASGDPGSALERAPSGIDGLVAELLLDAEQLVVLGDSVAPRWRARLDLADARRDREVGDGRVLGLARAVRHDRGIAVLARQIDRVEGLRERPDLVDLDQDRVADVLVDAAP